MKTRLVVKMRGNAFRFVSEKGVNWFYAECKCGGRAVQLEYLPDHGLSIMCLNEDCGEASMLSEFERMKTKGYMQVEPAKEKSKK